MLNKYSFLNEVLTTKLAHERLAHLIREAMFFRRRVLLEEQLFAVEHHQHRHIAFVRFEQMLQQSSQKRLVGLFGFRSTECFEPAVVDVNSTFSVVYQLHLCVGSHLPRVHVT